VPLDVARGTLSTPKGAARDGAREVKTLVIGFGNPGRGDDGIGPELARRLARLALPDVTVEMDYQLSVEHAALVAEHDRTVFVDATVEDLGEDGAPFSLRPVSDAPMDGGLTHFVSPGQVVSLARACFGVAPPCYLLGVRAYEMDEFAEGLTPRAEAGLEAALAHLVRVIEQSPRETSRLETSDAVR
jgi:hydrogenase maturation protease